VHNVLGHFKTWAATWVIQLHFLNSHTDYSPETLGSVSEEHGKRFQQDIMETEKEIWRWMDCELDGRLLLDAQEGWHLCESYISKTRSKKFHPSLEAKFKSQ
jgi:hypothetical protein